MATIKDISKLAHVSPGTVSRALSPEKSEYVAKQTRDKVRQVADKLGYKYSLEPKQSKNQLNFVLMTTLSLEEKRATNIGALFAVAFTKRQIPATLTSPV